MVRRFESLRIALFGLGAAVCYGILQDQVTARICPEYFTVGHGDLGMPSVFHNPSPTILAFAWGVVATWWVGLPLGIALSVCARAGGWPKLAASDLLRPILVLLAVMAVGAVSGGVFAYHVESVHRFYPSGLRPESQLRFTVDRGAHIAAYEVGLLGSLVLCGSTLLRRRRLARAEGKRS